MALEPRHGVLIVGMTGVAEDIQQALIAWHTATVLGGTGACSRETAGVLHAMFLQQDALQQHLMVPPQGNRTVLKILPPL
jgi:hypothetical protein